MPAPAGGLAPQAPHRMTSAGGSSIFTMVAMFLFIVSLLSVGGAYFAKYYFSKTQVTLQADLKSKEKDLPLNEIAHMKAQSTKITLARGLIDKHLSVTRLFSILSLLTAENIRFLSMDATIPAGVGGNIQMTLTGYGKDFTSLAFQSDVLNQLNNLSLQNVVKNPIISSPGLNKNGTVTFGFTAQVDPSSLRYSLGLPTTPVDAQSQNPADNTGTTTNQGL